jgi:hypothetical protein
MRALLGKVGARLGGRLGWPRVMAALGVLSAVVLAVSANVLVARYYHRWDFTTRRLYTLSDVTLNTLHQLGEPVEVVVLLSKSDPLELTVRQLLSSYTAEDPALSVRSIDPERSPAEFLAAQQKYGLLAGKTQDGRVVADAAVIVTQGDRRWFLTSDQLVDYDDDSGEARPRLEQALTEGLLSVRSRERMTVCMSTGHQELSLDDGSPRGLAELKYRLEKGNFEVQPLALESARSAEALAACRLVVVAGPGSAFSTGASERLRRHLEQGQSLLLLLGPVLGEDSRSNKSGLEPVLDRAGVELGRDLVLERDPALMAPVGSGETFQATPAAHAITSAMVKGDPLRVLVTGAQSLLRSKESTSSPLLKTSAQAVKVTDLASLLEGSSAPKAQGHGPFDLGVAMELPGPSGPGSGHGGRLVVVGTSSVVRNEVFREPTLQNARLFLENALSWLLARPAIVSVPPKAAQPVGLGLSEESLGEVARYVLGYMPAMALAMGILILYRRRAKERRSRRPASERGPV